MAAPEKKQEIAELVSRAQDGCQDSLGTLCEKYQNELSSYIYRLTLDKDLTEDILQETMMQLCRSLNDLRDANSIKAWLYKTAWGKAMNHYRSNKKHSSMSIDQNNLTNALENKRIEALKTLISKEIAETLVDSIADLDVKQRSVLTLRCYENLSYEQIASIMNCSETAARVQFYRAKCSLKRRLHRKGVTTVPMFLALLGLFGQITSPTQAATRVSAESLKVGALGTTVGWSMSKVGACILMMIASVAVVGGAFFVNGAAVSGYGSAPDTQIKSFHFIKHAWKEAYIPTANLRVGRSLSKGAYEQWFYFPEGIEGPMFKMMQRWDPQVENKLCSWLLDEDGQRYYHSGQNTIYVMNNPLAKRNTARFPSDSEDFCAFLESMEGEEKGVEYIRDAKTGLLKEIIDHRFINAPDFVSGIETNSFDETEFGDFKYKWHRDAKVVDERDAIHQQGWTVYEISGKINGQEVYGRCRIPFVFGTRGEHPPMLNLAVGDSYRVLDSPEGAYVVNTDNEVITSYPAGSFFKGLIRPWYGLHTIDLVRREAAKLWIPFSVENYEYDGYRHLKRIVKLHNCPEYNDLAVSFTIDIDANEISRIEFEGEAGTEVGVLEFDYPTVPGEITEEVEMPVVDKTWFSKREPRGILWLFDMAKGSLDD
ncbi:Sigma-24 [Anaerohalosphaera lusitana]|uniref:Sigma-24 n=1 Tax=Anaerohalosphaera lusitana TaxID=1936003 RepID=A0A1U9NQ88_9BACT|nr:RNA polymerase sigma factor [Anaerohalosphaera lusitana]AQT69780.1 Sigma-24 [Anaerohalosphaera lusitana]